MKCVERVLHNASFSLYQYMHMQSAICRLCSRHDGIMQREVWGAFTLWACTHCQGQFWEPFKNPGADWYEQDQRYHDRNIDPLLTPVNSHLLLLEDNPSPGGDVLDIGCGTGNFLAAAQKAGYRVHGIDFDRDAIAVAKEVFHLTDVQVRSTEELAAEEKSYDVITFFEVLEHLDNPTEFLASVRAILRTRGYIGLSVPDGASWSSLKVHDKPPRHLTRWTKKSLQTFLERSGFQVVRIVQKPITLSVIITKFHFWTIGIFSFGLVRRVQRRKSAQSNAIPPHKDVVIQRLKKLALWKDRLLFTVPAALVWMYLFLTRQLTSGLYVLARKND